MRLTLLSFWVPTIFRNILSSIEETLLYHNAGALELTKRSKQFRIRHIGQMENEETGPEQKTII